MITFKSSQTCIKTADILTRKAHSIYPHASTTQLNRRLSLIKKGKNLKHAPFLRILNEKLSNLRSKRKSFGFVNFSSIIDCLKYARVGNCFESSSLARILGILNGQQNINVGSIVVKRKGVVLKIDHAIAFIAKNKPKGNSVEYYSGKDAIIIDPWLGITDWVNNYFTRIKNEHRYLLQGIKKDENAVIGILNSCNPTLQEFEIDALKDIYPELTLKNYKPIKL